MKNLDEFGKWLAGWMWNPDGWMASTTGMGVLMAGVYVAAVAVIWMIVGLSN